MHRCIYDLRQFNDLMSSKTVITQYNHAFFTLAYLKINDHRQTSRYYPSPLFYQFL
jgi:hypothetical protein